MTSDDNALKAANIFSSFRRTGVQLTLVSIMSAIILGIIDQFTSKIVPTTADYIHDLFFPPQFFVHFSPPVDVSGGISLFFIPSSSPSEISLKETVPGTHVFAASAAPGTYVLRLRGSDDRRGKELVDTKTIAKSGETWQVDTSERNWANSAAIRSGAPTSDPAAPQSAPVSSRLSGTRWTVTEQDYAVLAQIDNSIRRSLLAGALGDVGIFESGTDWEKQHLAAYWQAIRPAMSNSQDTLPWGGAFLAWVARHAYLEPPSQAAAFGSWLQWGRDISPAELKPGMIAIFRLDNAEVPQARSRLLVGPVLRQQSKCIEVVLGNIANRVVISCVATNLLVKVKDAS